MPSPQELGSDARRARRARGSLSAEEILRGAFTFVETHSVDTLSMPRLGRHLGVGVTSIYWYFKSKDELLDAMTETALEQFYELLPEFPGLPWDEHLKEFFRATRRIFRQNSVLCDLVIMRNGNFTSRGVRSTWDRIEGIIRALVEAGFSTDDATSAYFALSVYTRGCLIVERMTQLMPTRPQSVSVRRALHQEVGAAEQFPILAEQSHRTSFSMVEEADFEFGLESTVAGLRTLLS